MLSLNILTLPKIIPGPYTVKKAVKLLEAPSRIAILMLNKYNSTVGIYCLSSCVFLFPPCCWTRKFDIGISLKKLFQCRIKATIQTFLTVTKVALIQYCHCQKSLTVIEAQPPLPPSLTREHRIVFKYKFDQFLLKIWVFKNQQSHIFAP